MPVAHYEENLSFAEAYSDRHLQPAVVMKRLGDAQYVPKFEIENEKFENFIFPL